MKVQVYQSKYVDFHFDDDTSIFYEHWTSENLEDGIYKEEMQRKCELMEDYNPKFILDDISETDFTIVPELQEWTENLLNPILNKLEVKKYAVVLPKPIFGQVSLDQAIDELKETNYVTLFEYFDNIPDAEHWLKN